MYFSRLKVVWISEKNGNGICLDNSGNECYIDSSISGFDQLSRNDIVSGNIDRLGSTLCVRSLLSKYNSDILLK